MILYVLVLMHDFSIEYVSADDFVRLCIALETCGEDIVALNARNDYRKES